MTIRTRHRVSTSMYSLTFCVRFLLPERHQWKPAVQTAAVMLRTPPSAAGRRRAGRARFPYVARRFGGTPPSPAGPRRSRPAGRSHYVVISRDRRKLVTSNATRAPIANPPNSAQLGGSLYHASKLRPGPCSSVGVWPRTDRHTDARDHNTFCVVYDSRKM